MRGVTTAPESNQACWTCGPANRLSEDPETREVQQHALELLDEFRDRGSGIALADPAREAFRLLGEIPKLVHWDEGLDEAQRAIIQAAVQQAERFGDGTGAFKRRFAIDLIVRALRSYNQNGFPFIPPIEDAFVKPFLGIFVDWSVVVLNLHDAWPPVKSVHVPKIFEGRYGPVVWLGMWVLRQWIWLNEMFLYTTKYERNLRDATAAIEPETRQLLDVLPPQQIAILTEELASIIARVGQLTAPHVRSIDSLLRLSVEMQNLAAEERREVVVVIFRDLLAEAYADTPFALDFIESRFGDFLIGEMVRMVDGVLARNGLLARPD